MARERSNSRQTLEKSIMDKIQSIFDNADHITDFEIMLRGGVEEVTSIEYRVAERIVPQSEENA